ncbi:MAG: hypothetical protein DSY80_06205 [Desulfocapsa sp.]|nr:MAG: hypothetical protein DSY80_06205 [Desulfocapsa sp.]
MTSCTKTIILFTRYPRPGECKTRLLPEYSPEEAAVIHRQLTACSDKTISDYLAQYNSTTYHIYYTGASVKEMTLWFGKRKFRQQQGENLGERMADAFSATLQHVEQCLLIGADCPDITPDLLEKGFSALKNNDIVLGPAYDGGYYLIGLKQSLPTTQLKGLFKDIPWGSNTVLSKTLERAENLQLQLHLLEKLHDIDTPDDLQYCNHYSYVE